jgi:hypothetical protein
MPATMSGYALIVNSMRLSEAGASSAEPMPGGSRDAARDEAPQAGGILSASQYCQWTTASEEQRAK